MTVALAASGKTSMKIGGVAASGGRRRRTLRCCCDGIEERWWYQRHQWRLSSILCHSFASVIVVLILFYAILFSTNSLSVMSVHCYCCNDLTSTFHHPPAIVISLASLMCWRRRKSMAVACHYSPFVSLSAIMFCSCILTILPVRLTFCRLRKAWRMPVTWQRAKTNNRKR